MEELCSYIKYRKERCSYIGINIEGAVLLPP